MGRERERERERERQRQRQRQRQTDRQTDSNKITRVIYAPLLAHHKDRGPKADTSLNTSASP